MCKALFSNIKSPFIFDGESIHSRLPGPMGCKKTMMISRLTVITMIALAFIGALNPQLGIMRMMLKLTFPSYTVLVPCVVAIFWKKASAKGIITGLILGSIAAITQALGFISPPFGVYSLFYNVIITSLGIVIVSIATGGPSGHESLEVFQNPVVKEELY